MKVAVIGGGAAGMMAACAVAESGQKVLLFERNRLCGVKINLTGKGRCNVTNNCSLDRLISNTPRNGKFLYSAFSGFTAQDAMAFFEDMGVALKTERGDRVFPVSDNAKDISAALRGAMQRAGVEIIHTRISDICVSNGAVCGVKDFDGVTYPADRVILATGGLAYPRTGSDGDGYKMARRLGHSVTETHPSLVPLRAAGSLPGMLEGLSLRNVGITVSKHGREVYSDFGELVFTSDGLSGPVILSASAHLNRKDSFPYDFFIDLKPALSREVLDKRLLRDFGDNINRDFRNSLSALLPSKLIPVVVRLSGIPGDVKVNAVTKKQRESLCSLLKALPFEITGTASYHEAVVTSGGVSVKEINPKTMESKLVSGLFFAGEIIDVDAYTGGFNLQIAWSTGHCAGRSAAL